MEILKRIIFVSILFVSLCANSQSFFYKKYSSNSPFDTGNGIAQLPDSSYAVTGTSGGFDTNSGEAYLMLVDSLGEHLWTKHYGGSGDDVGVRVFHRPNEGFYIAGYSNSTVNGDFDFVVYKLNEQGDLVWEKKYGDDNWQVLHDAVMLNDGGLLLVGETVGTTTDNKDIALVRIDSQGEVTWTKEFGDLGNDIAYGVDTVSASQFVVVGIKELQESENGFIGLYDLVDGEEVWQQTLDSKNVTTLRDVVTYKTAIYVAGAYYNEVKEQEDKWLGKFDFNGNFIDDWKHSYNRGSMFTALTIREDLGMYGALISDADEIEGVPGDMEAIVSKFKIDMYYNEFSEKFAGVGDDIINQMIVSHDGGITLVGTASDIEHLPSNGTVVMIAKISANDEMTGNADLGNDLVSLMEETFKNIEVYPNPTSDKINIPEEAIGLSFELSNAQGKIVRNGKLGSTLVLEDLRQGVYFLMVSDRKQVFTGKIVKQ